LAPFFGIPVLSNTAPSRIARISGAPVLPYFIERVSGGAGTEGRGYRVVIGEPLADFPSADEAADVARLHALVEAQARDCPAQYLWTYKRFRRPGVDPYRKS
jgi:KDO2-lipid IV(A) lauroyltransferase